MSAVEDYLKGIRSVMQISTTLEVAKWSVRRWVKEYQAKGLMGLQTSSHNAFYPSELKVQAVADYLEGKGSLIDVCQKYRISSDSVLRRWIKSYNGHEVMKSHNSKGDIIRRKRKNYIPSTPQITAENILNREFHADKPNQKWLTDVTEFKLANGQKAYLSAILDLGDKSIVSYVLGHFNNNQLVFDTFLTWQWPPILMHILFFIATEVFSIPIEYLKTSLKALVLPKVCPVSADA